MVRLLASELHGNTSAMLLAALGARAQRRADNASLHSILKATRPEGQVN
jgi:hypothetical protein